MTVAEAISAYARHLRRLGRSEATVTTYTTLLRELERRLGPGALLLDLGVQDLEDWQDAMLARRLEPASRGLAITACRSLLRWAVEHELADPRLLRDLRPLRRRRGVPHPIPPEDLAKIQVYLDRVRAGAGVGELRDVALFYVLLTTGARISEALQMRRQGYRRAVVREKGGGEKALVMPPSVWALVDRYLERRWDDLPCLWVTSQRPVRELSAGAAQRIWRRLAKRIGVPRWTSHELRHTCGTEMARADVPLQVISDHLGHATLDMTLNYVKIVAEQRRANLEALERLVRVGTGQARPRWVKLRGRADRRRKPG